MDCLVCGKIIRPSDNEVFAMNGGHRHKRCGPGSKAWGAKHGTSEIHEMLKPRKRTPKAKAPVHPRLKPAKELVGRVKYMRYMDTINKHSVEWAVTSLELGVTVDKSNTTDPEILLERLLNA
jgi:hypothetical protein